MPKRSRDPKQPALFLKLETTDRSNPNVDAEKFFDTAEKWLGALKAFAIERGEHVTWEIVDLRKSSAFVQVQPVKIRTGKVAPSLGKYWNEGLRKIEKTGRPVAEFTAESLAALQEFVSSIPQDTIVSVGNGSPNGRRVITALTQGRVLEAVSRLPREQRREYLERGSIRGRLAVLDSWNQDDRSFRLQLPLAPNRHMKCTYHDISLVSSLGQGFEGMVEITGDLRYKPNQPWPYSAEVSEIRVLPREPVVSLKDLAGLIQLPNGQDSVSYIRSLRDAEQQ